MSKIFYLSFITLLSGNAMCMSPDSDISARLSGIIQELADSGKKSYQIQKMIDDAGLTRLRNLEIERHNAEIQRIEQHEAERKRLAMSKKPTEVMNADILNDIAMCIYDPDNTASQYLMLGDVKSNDLNDYEGSWLTDKEFQDKKTLLTETKTILMNTLCGENNNVYTPLEGSGFDIFPLMLSTDSCNLNRYLYSYYNDRNYEKLGRIEEQINKAYSVFNAAQDLKAQINDMIKSFDNHRINAIKVSNLIAFIRELTQHQELSKSLNLNLPQIDIKQNRAELFQYILENEHLIDAIVDASNVDDEILEDFEDDADDIQANIGFISDPISKDDVISALKTYSYENIEKTVDNIFSHSSFVNVLVEINKMRVMWPHYEPVMGVSNIYVANVLNDKLNLYIN